jgi:hypothetical protein
MGPLSIFARVFYPEDRTVDEQTIFFDPAIKDD